LNALWGKLAAEVLMQNWDIALEELNRLKEIIDSKVVHHFMYCVAPLSSL
jgi:translation initiation factor 3 subunit E